MISLSSMRYRFRRPSKDEVAALVERYRNTSRWCTGVDSYLNDYEWWIHEGDLRLPTDVENDIHLIVTGDLVVDGWYDDYQGAGMLAVFGNMRCRHVFSWYTLYVDGDLQVQGLNLQYYNDWVFECGGQVAARAFIGSDKSCSFDLQHADIEGYYNSMEYGPESSLKPYAMLGLLELDEDSHEPDDGDPDDDDEYEDIETPDESDVIAYVKAAEAEGRSPFVTPEPTSHAIWCEVLRADTLPSRLSDLIESHGWDVSMRPHLPPELQNRLAMHDDARVRWALASSPHVQEAVLRQLASDHEPTVRAAVAGHAHCPDDLWSRLAADAAPEVRATIVHAHGMGPADWVIPLAGDASAVVRSAVAVVPGLPPAVVTALSNDTDARVKHRVLRVQQQSIDSVRAQFDSPDESVRLALAGAAVAGSPPFSQTPADLALRKQALMRFMLDASPRVRKAATVYFLPPVFYEEHAQRFATDEVEDIRSALASRTRQAAWLDILADDASQDVRLSVARNPHTSADTLMKMAQAVVPITFGWHGTSRDAGTLLENPCLPADAVALLYAQYPAGHDIGPHANAPVKAMIQRICEHGDNDPGEPEYLVYQHCLRAFEGDAQPSEKDQDALFRYIIDARLYELGAHALANRSCPADLLAHHVDDHLRKEDKDGCYEMRHVAANPALPGETLRKLAAYLLENHDHEVKEGLLHHPACPAELLAALALGANDANYRREACDALWRWHGIVESDIAQVPPAQLGTIDWRDTPGTPNADS